MCGDSDTVKQNSLSIEKYFFYFANHLDESEGRCSDSALKLGSHRGVGFSIVAKFFSYFPLKKISKMQTLCYQDIFSIFPVCIFSIFPVCGFSMFVIMCLGVCEIFAREFFC